MNLNEIIEGTDTRQSFNFFVKRNKTNLEKIKKNSYVNINRIDKEDKKQNFLDQLNINNLHVQINRNIMEKPLLIKKEQYTKILNKKKMDDYINQNYINYPIINKKTYFKDFTINFKDNIDHNLNDNKKVSNFFNSSSSSIIKLNDLNNNYLINMRCVNYNLDTNGESSIKSENDVTFTSNILLIVDSKFKILKKSIIYPEIDDIPYIGIEDIRIINFDDKIFYIGSSFNKLTNKVQITSYEYSLNENFKINFIEPSFITDNLWEKNWVFFVNDSELLVIYKWNPIYICKIDYEKNNLNLFNVIESPDFFSEFRGSTNGILFNDKFWFIVHSRVKNNNNKYSYYHSFVVLNKNLTIFGYSKKFKFEKYLVEYCIGMEIDDFNFIILYSKLDKTTALITLDKNFISSLIIPFKLKNEIECNSNY